MNTRRLSHPQKWMLAGGILFLLLAIPVGAFFWYVSDYYRADDLALEVLAQGEGISARDNLTILSPSFSTDTAMILPRSQSGGDSLPASAVTDPPDRNNLYPGSHALPHGDL